MMMNFDLPLSQIFKRDLLTCPPEMTVAVAAARMFELRVGSILIEVAGRVVGIWTEHDALAMNLADSASFTRPVGEVMSSPVKTISMNATVGEAAIRFKQERIRHLLAINSEGVPVGVVTQTDVINHQGIEFYVHMRSVDSVIKVQPVVVASDTSLPEVVQLMRESRVDAAIVEHHGAYGILTGRDVLRLISSDTFARPASEVATFPLITVPHDSSLYQARQIFAERGIRHLGVAHEGKVIGLLSYADILDSIEHEYVRELQAALHDQSLKLQKSKLALLLATKVAETSQQAIIIANRDRIIQSVNPAFTAITGYKPDEAIGRDTGLLRSGLHDAPFYQALYAALDAHGVWSGELWNRRKSGEIYPEAMTITEVRNEENELVNYVCVFSDISEQRRSLSDLKESKEQLEEQSNLTEMILDTLPVMVSVKDEDGRYVLFNEMAAHSIGGEIGRKKSNLLGKTDADLFPPHVVDMLRQVEDEAMRTEQVVVREDHFFDATGQRSYLAYRRAVQLGSRRLMIGAAIDITKRKRAENLLGAEKEVLELIAAGAELAPVLEALALKMEKQIKGVRVAVLLYRQHENRFKVGAAPNLPLVYCQRIESLVIGADAGTSGEAVLTGQQQVSEDVWEDERWTGKQESLNAMGIRAVWSAPIFSSTRRVLGLFNLYFSGTRKPSKSEQDTIEHACKLAAIALERAEANAELHRLATVDMLTGLNNRAHFLALGETELGRSQRFGRSLGVLMLDIDYFKRINDTHGHAAGDLALQAVSAAIVRELRTVDILGRLGGEEFAVILPEADVMNTIQVAERIRGAVERSRVDIGTSLRIPLTISIGATVLRPSENNIDRLLARADAALYRAKRSGRNRVVFSEDADH